jgi:hypothetical protein
MYSRCKDCDCRLWSNEAKKIGLCPECFAYENNFEEADSGEEKDLEDRLDSVVRSMRA